MYKIVIYGHIALFIKRQDNNMQKHALWGSIEMKQFAIGVIASGIL